MIIKEPVLGGIHGLCDPIVGVTTACILPQQTDEFFGALVHVIKFILHGDIFYSILPGFPCGTGQNVGVAKDRNVIQADFAEILVLVPTELERAIIVENTPVENVGNEGDTQHFERSHCQLPIQVDDHLNLINLFFNFLS